MRAKRLAYATMGLVLGCSVGIDPDVSGWPPGGGIDPWDDVGETETDDDDDDAEGDGESDGTDGGGVGDWGTGNGADDGGPDDPALPDLDCDPQPPWYIPGAPLTTDPTEYGQWRWIEVDGMVCADGSQGGFFASFTADPRDLLIFFGGGGVCYDFLSCTLDTPLLLGMGPAPLAMWLGDTQSHSGVFDRNDPSNPFRDANIAYFPHCTGDGHTADKISSYPILSDIHQRGYANVQRALTVLGPTFEDAERVTVAGFSAGGIGSLANYHQIAWLFECLGHPSPLLINDAGPVLRKPHLSDHAQESLREGWGLDTTFDDLCPACDTDGYHLALQRIRELHPGARTSLVVAYGDTIVRDLYAALRLDPGFASDPHALRAGLLDYASWTAGLPDPDGTTRHREFFYPSERHGALVVAPLAHTPGLAEFLQAQVDDAPGWSNVHP